LRGKGNIDTAGHRFVEARAGAEKTIVGTLRCIFLGPNDEPH